MAIDRPARPGREGARAYWTELVEAEDRRPVDGHGGHFSWGRGSSPGVSGWYPLGSGSARVLWTASTSTGTEAARPYMYFYTNEARARVPEPQFEAFFDALASIPVLADQIARTRDAGWVGKNRSVYLTDLTDSTLEDVLAAIDTLVPG